MPLARFGMGTPVSVKNTCAARSAKLTSAAGLEVVALDEEVARVGVAGGELGVAGEESVGHVVLVVDDGLLADPVEGGHDELDLRCRWLRESIAPGRARCKGALERRAAAASAGPLASPQSSSSVVLVPRSRFVSMGAEESRRRTRDEDEDDSRIPAA
ncbi:MAG: hypothetical protein FJ290_01840 [Planctomycetes bacterium]|nr:hypothetical protein [Planctomycetota bacterium]